MKPTTVLLLALFLSLPAAALTTVYTDRATWEAAVPAFTVDGLETYPPQSTTAGTLQYGDFDFYVDHNHSALGNRLEGSNMILVGDVHGPIPSCDTDPSDCGSYQEIIFHDPIQWFGVDVLWTEDETAIQMGVLGESFTEVTGPAFIGFLSDVAFTTIRIEGNRVFYWLDNLSYESTAAVPEPSTALLLALGLMALGTRIGARSTIGPI